MNSTQLKDGYELSGKIPKPRVVAAVGSLFSGPGPKDELCVSPRIHTQQLVGSALELARAKTENEAEDVRWLASGLKDACVPWFRTLMLTKAVSVQDARNRFLRTLDFSRNPHQNKTGAAM